MCRHEDGPQHDCEYVTAVDALIVGAAYVANHQVKEPDEPEGYQEILRRVDAGRASGADQAAIYRHRQRVYRYGMEWNRVFHREMARITEEEGLRQPVPKLQAVA